MLRWAILLSMTSFLQAEPHSIIVRGLGGEPRYDERFREESEKLAEALRKGSGADGRVLLLAGDDARRERLAAAFERLRSEVDPKDTVAVFLVGHGNYDGENYKFNIPGPDLTAKTLAELLNALPAERQLVVNTTSSSGASLEALRAQGRAVVTATKSGRERTATIFSKYWTEAFGDSAADLDKNETISAQEAFEFARSKVEAFFETGNLLATEHAQLEGEIAPTFTLARLGSAAAASNDPELRPLVDEKERLETKIEQLKLRKDALTENEYFDELQSLLLELAAVQERITAATETTP